MSKECAAAIAEHFRDYNEEFSRITRRAALNFLAEDWPAAQRDAVARIELYDQRVTRCVAAVSDQLGRQSADVAAWSEVKRVYDMLVVRKPDSDFYRTFFNSVCRDLFGTVGVDPQVEFCATNVGRASGAVTLRVYRVGGSLPGAVREVLADLSFSFPTAGETRLDWGMHLLWIENEHATAKNVAVPKIDVRLLDPQKDHAIVEKLEEDYRGPLALFSDPCWSERGAPDGHCTTPAGMQPNAPPYVPAPPLRRSSHRRR